MQSRAGQPAGRLGSLALFLERSPSSVSRSCERCRKHLHQPYGMYVYYACMWIRQYETNPIGCAAKGGYRNIGESIAERLDGHQHSSRSGSSPSTTTAAASFEEDVSIGDLQYVHHVFS